MFSTNELKGKTKAEGIFYHERHEKHENSLIRCAELKKTFYLILSILFIHAYGGQALLKPDLATNYTNFHEN